MSDQSDDNRFRSRVMVACVVDEVLMITTPAMKYKIDRIHLINYVKKPKDGDEGSRGRYELFSDIYQTVYDTLKNMGIEIVEHRDKPTYDFESMASVLFEILSDEKSKESDVFVSLTGGTMVYAAATSLISMMFDNTKLFNVGVNPEDHTISDYGQIRKNLMYEGKLVGSAKKVIETPFEHNPIPIQPPDRKLLFALKVFDSISPAKRSNSNVIRNLMKQNLWVIPSDDPDYQGQTSYSLEDHDTFLLEDSKNGAVYKALKNKEGVQYQRLFIDKWKHNQWIEKDEDAFRTKYVLTEAGTMYLNVFCPSFVFDFGPEDVVYQKKKSQ